MEPTDETVYVSYNFKTSINRLVENILVPSMLAVKCEVEILDLERVDVALRKIEYWLDYYVRNAIAISASNTNGFDMILDENKTPRLQNSLMITPGEPTDEHLAMIFQSKLQALGCDNLMFGAITVSSDDSAGLVFTYVGDSESELPTMENWISAPTWFDKPWWRRDDASMIDTQAPDGSDLTETPPWAHSLDFLEKIGNNPEAIIIKADFEPKIIDATDTEE